MATSSLSQQLALPQFCLPLALYCLRFLLSNFGRNTQSKRNKRISHFVRDLVIHSVLVAIVQIKIKITIDSRLAYSGCMYSKHRTKSLGGKAETTRDDGRVADAEDCR